MSAFPIQPLFDRVIVREIPIEAYFTEDEKKMLPLDDARFKLRYRYGIVVAIGRKVEEAATEDLVVFEDTAMYDPIYLRAIDELHPKHIKFWQIRESDLKAKVVGALKPVELAGEVAANVA